MASVFSNQSATYNEVASPRTGSAAIKISFSLNPEGLAKLYLMHRPTGSSDPYKPKVFNGKDYLDRSDSLSVDVTGMQYYYRLKVNGDGVAAYLTEY